MGATGCHRQRGLTNLEFFRKEFGKRQDGKERLVDAAQTRGDSSVYFAYLTDDDKIIALVISETSWHRGDYFNYTYRDAWGEDDGIYSCKCPKRILDQLSPAHECFEGKALANAMGWRAACHANLESLKTIPRLKDGDVVKLTKTLCFRNGAELDTFNVRERPHWTRRGIKPKLYFTDAFTTYRIPKRHLIGAQVISN